MDLSKLNKEQKTAVEHRKGPLLVLSGAGTGKTRVLTSRFVYIVKNLNVNFNKIIAVTFTNNKHTCEWGYFFIRNFLRWNLWPYRAYKQSGFKF